MSNLEPIEFEFHPADEEALDEVLALFKETALKIQAKNVDHWQYWIHPPIEKIAWVKEGLSRGEYYFIRDLHEKTIGMVRIMEKDEYYWGLRDDQAFYVHSLVIKEAYNGRGLGALVLQKIAVKARAKDCEFLRLDAVATNVKLCRFYESLGFVKVGVKKVPLSSNNLYQLPL